MEKAIVFGAIIYGLTWDRTTLRRLGDTVALLYHQETPRDRDGGSFSLFILRESTTKYGFIVRDAV